MKRMPTDGATITEATLERCAEAAFSWRLAPGAATFDHHGHLLGTDESRRHLRRWRLSDAAVIDEREVRAPFELWGACTIAAQPLDADTVIFGCEERAIALLDARTLAERGRVSLASSQRATVFARAGALVIVEDFTRVRVLDPGSFEERSRWELTMTHVRWCAPSSHGEHVIVGDLLQTLVHDARSGAERPALDGRRARYAAVNDRTRTIGAVLDDDAAALLLRSLDGGGERRVPLMHDGALVTVSVDGALWLCATDRGAVHGVDGASGEVRWTRVLDGRVSSLSISPDGRWVAACTGQRVAVLDAATGAIARYGGPSEPMTALYACDGAVVGAPDDLRRCAPHLWEVDAPAPRVPRVMRGAKAAAAGRWIAEYGSTIERYASAESAAVDRARVVEAPPEANAGALAVAEDGDVYAGVWRVESRRKTSYDIDRMAADGRIETLSRALPKVVRWIHVAEDAGVLLACLDHRELFVIDRANGQVASTIKGLKKPAYRAVCSRDARSVCAVTIDGALAFFRDGVLVAMHKHAQPKDLCFAPDERTLFTATLDAVFAWDPLTGDCRERAPLPLRVVALCVATGPDADGRTLYVSAEDAELYRVTLAPRAAR